MADELFAKPFTGNWTLVNVTVQNEQLLLGQPGYAISETWKTGAGNFHIFKNKYGSGVDEDFPDFDYRTSSDREGIENADWQQLVTNNIVSLGYVQLRIMLYESVSSSSRSSSSSSNSSSSSCKSSSSSSCRSSSSSCRSSSSSSSSSYFMSYIFGEGRPAGDTSYRWENVETSDDGSKVIAAVDGGRVYFSSDYGVSWIELQPEYPSGPYNRYWRSVGISGDGNVLMCYEHDYGLYISTNGGGTWFKKTPYEVNGWGSLVSSTNGDRLIASGSDIYTSSDYGVTWIKRQPAGIYSKWWYGCACSSTGSFVVAAYGGGYYDFDPNHYNYDGRIYTSSDYGVTWTERRPAGDVGYRWHTLTCNSTGNFIMVGGHDSLTAGNGRIYISSDYGVSWTETRPLGDVDRAWYGLACNESGTVLMAALGSFSDNACLFISLNGGVTWDPFPKTYNDFSVGLTANNDMSKVYVGQGYGYIKLGTSTF